MNRESINTIKLTDHEKKALEDEIKAMYLDERDEEIGLIELQQLMDLFMENMAPIIYNKALDDAKKWYTRQMDNLEADYYMMYKE